MAEERKRNIGDRMNDLDGIEFNYSSKEGNDDSVLAQAIDAVAKGIEGLEEDNAKDESSLKN